MIRKLSIQSKLMLMLLVVCITSIVAIAYLGYSIGQQALNQSIFNQLTSLRESKAYQIESYFKNIRAQVQTVSETRTIVEATKAFKAAYQELEGKSISPAWNETLKQYYTKQFLPKLAENVAGTPLLFSYLPADSASRYLQYQYIANNPHSVGKKYYLNNPQDSSKYSLIHAQIQPIYRNFISKFGYYDLFLIDAATGNIIYSVSKEVDFATNLYTGPYANSNLGTVAQEALKGQDPGFVAIADFEPYRPSYAIPAAFIASPIFDGSELIGILAFQLSIDEINRIMTGNENWQRDGLGNSGETYLVGSDYLMRSMSRFLIENPQKYIETQQANGLSEEEIEHLKKLGTSILHQEVRTPVVEQAFAKQTGIDTIDDYRGIPTLTSYRPLDIQGLDWAIIAQIDQDEAFAPIYTFQQQVMISTAVIVLLVTLIASILSYNFVRPIKTLIDGFRQVSSGKTNVVVKVKSKDEFRELANSFNDMVRNLNHHEQLVQQKNQENENLLLSILPEPVAQRLKDGENNIADSFSNVTVMFADLVGFLELCNTLTPDKTVTCLNELVTAFDEAAERHGVEKVKTIGSGYMAVSGLSVPRLDHAKRMIDFAVEMLRIVRCFNQEKGTDLKLRIGVNSGPVVAGIVGRSKFIYDLWGDTVNIAHRLQSLGERDRIQVTKNIYTRLADIYDFKPIDDIEIPGKGKLVAWSLKL